MADFSDFTGPSGEWIAFERTLPLEPKDLTVEQLKETSNKNREDLAAREMVDQGLDKKVTIHNYNIPTREGRSLEARAYHHVDVNPSQILPVYIHLHGGGFLFGTLSSEDSICSRIAVTLAEANMPLVVVNVNYRHTPEYRYPTPWDDVEDAFYWIHDHIDEIGGDCENVIMGGISAGAWLTASTTLAQHLSTNKKLSIYPKIKGQILMIPALVHYNCYEPQLGKLKDPKMSSWVDNHDAPILPRERVELFMTLLGVEGGREAETDLRLNPGNAIAEQVRGLPPTAFGIAGRDPLRDEGLFYAQLLNDNGVPTRLNVFNGVPHGFRRYGELSVSKKWDEFMAGSIKWALSDPILGPFVIRSC